jgi:hypothetical protein
MSTISHKGLNEIAEAAGLQLRSYSGRSYSGRGMYGAVCVGLDCDNVLEALGELAENTEDCTIIAHLLKTAYSDSMGRGQIVYWPDIEWDKELLTGEEE